MDIHGKLFDFKKKRKKISLDELHSLISSTHLDAPELLAEINKLIEEGAIKPVDASGTNGNLLYPLYKVYRITIEKKPDGVMADEIKELHPLLQNNNFLKKNPEMYKKHRNDIKALNRYLFNRGDDERISRKERSFQIFGKEKLLDASEKDSIWPLISGLKIEEELRFYDTPEYWFPEYIPQRKSKMKLLICENKDIWFNIRRRMSEDGVMDVFGCLFDGVVYGMGNKISQINALTMYTKFMGDVEVDYLYWGDMDLEGYSIYERTVNNNPDISINLFVEGYCQMIKRAEKRKWNEDSPSDRNIVIDREALYALFEPNERMFLKRMLEESKLIPQEIITYIDLKR